MLSHVCGQYLVLLLGVLSTYFQPLVFSQKSKTSINSKDSSIIDKSGVIIESGIDLQNIDKDTEPPWVSHYAIDPYEARRLAMLEYDVTDVLSEEVLQARQVSSVEEFSPCYLSIIKYLGKHEKDKKILNQGQRIPQKDGSIIVGTIGMSRAGTIVSGNPVFLLRLIHRLVVTLSKETMKICSAERENKIIVDAVNEVFKDADMTFPTQQDLDDALEGLLRIHYIYGLNASDIRLGIFHGVHTNATLEFDDCLALAEKAIQIKTDALAYQWLISAHMNIPNDELPLSKELEKRLDKIWKKLMSLSKVNSTQNLYRKLANKRQETMNPLADFQYYATCRNEPVLEAQVYSSCFYADLYWDPYFTINPVKVEVLSYYPEIIQVYDFVGKKAIKTIQSSIMSPLQRATTVNFDTPTVDSVRTSMNTFIFDTEEFDPNPVLLNLNRRVEKLIKLHVSKPRSSLGLQLAIYSSLGGHYDIHHDAYMNETPKEQLQEGWGNRMATFLIYLTDVRMGGNTAFPDVGVAAKPIKGSAIFWFNVLRNGDVDNYAVHAGCPVILGQKQVANRWIMEYENMFKRPCDLNPHA